MFDFFWVHTIDHDDRSERKTDNRRRVSFKPSGAGPPGGRQNYKFQVSNADLAIRSRLEDDDEMIDFPANGRSDSNVRLKVLNLLNLINCYLQFQTTRGGKGIRARRRGSPIPRGGHGPPGKKKLFGGSSGWFQVTVTIRAPYDCFFTNCLCFIDTTRPKIR